MDFGFYGNGFVRSFLIANIYDVFGIGIPLIAGKALTRPFGALMLACGADVDLFEFHLFWG
jgi:hypothetical protein